MYDKCSNMIDLSAYSLADLRKVGAAAAVVECASDPQRRALAAYFRGGSTEPPRNGTLPLKFEGKTYLALVGAEQLLAVYRLRNDLQLKRLRRIPLPVAAAAELARLESSRSEGAAS
jgi:hypothetical protein